MTLLAKIYRDSQLDQVKKNLESTLQGLKVKIDFHGVNTHGFVQVSVSGEDDKVALRYLADNIGLCPTDMEDVNKFSTFKGFLTDPARSKNELWVDIGISPPDSFGVSIPLSRLQAQIGDGRKIALGKLAEIYGFCKNLPLHVRVTEIDFEKKRFEGELSENQQRRYTEWTRSLLDRLLIVGASYDEVKAVVKITASNRDVIKIEPMGIFEHAVVCKLGTDAVGLMPRFGKYLSRATFSVFNPKKILELLGSDSAAKERNS